MQAAVLVYRDDNRRVRTAAALARVAAPAAGATPADTALSLFIDVAELEAAIVDALAPERDGLDPVTCAMRRATLAAASQVRVRNAQVGRRDTRAHDATVVSSEIRQALDVLGRHTLPGTLAMRVSEGYAYYALFPETYAISAERFWTSTRPSRVAVIGIRSIGTGLSAIVAETLRARGCDTWSCTVRPHGHPFDRRVFLASDLEAAWRCEADRGAVFAVVDEGPGLSGSSFASVLRAIQALGVPDHRVVVFPSWDPDPDRLKSAHARRAWRRHARWCTDARTAGFTPERLLGIGSAVADCSAGAWRSILLDGGREWPAAHPQHERWKISVPAERRIIRFAGLGRYGAVARERALALFELHAGVDPGRLCDGFLDLPFVPGRPLTACTDTDDAIAIGRYIAAVVRAFPADEPADTASLWPVIETNVRELLDDGAVDRARAAAGEPPPDLPAAFIDGRMLAHEWIRTDVGWLPSDRSRPGSGGTLLKVDALDHARDHFYPGPQSAAWDLAAAALELAMDGPAEAAMLDAFEGASEDRRARGALAFYKVAYAAFRGGYAAMAAETLAGSDEGKRFARLRDRWRGRLQSALTPNAP